MSDTDTKYPSDHDEEILRLLEEAGWTPEEAEEELRNMGDLEDD